MKMNLKIQLWALLEAPQKNVRALRCLFLPKGEGVQDHPLLPLNTLGVSQSSPHLRGGEQDVS